MNVYDNFDSHPLTEDDGRNAVREVGKGIISTHILSQRMTQLSRHGLTDGQYFDSHPLTEDDTYAVTVEMQ